jgi:hypothetical protein
MPIRDQQKGFIDPLLNQLIARPFCPNLIIGTNLGTELGTKT